jgi:DnaK suppressor protein
VSPDATATGPHGALRESLEAERDSLRSRLAELGFGSEALSYDSNFADSSQVTAERGEAEALAASLMATLTQVERALAKFDDSTYGVCESCGGDIAYARLEAKPEARYCISCAASRR